MKKLASIFQKSFLGPGFVTGASDNDPSGIATYSLCGATSGYNLLWASLLTLPMMIVVQEMAARVALVSGFGLTTAMKRYFPRPLVLVLIYVLVFANTLNIAADLAGMAAASALIIPINPKVLIAVFTAIFLAVEISCSYRIFNTIAKILAVSLLAYVVDLVVLHPSLSLIASKLFIPYISRDPQWILLFVGFLGTTITPYMLFWQASQELEEQDSTSIVKRLRSMRIDTASGMFFSNIVTACIVITTAMTLYARHVTIVTAADAAAALKPVAGEASSLLFALGIVGVGMLAVPVLATSSAYALAELHDWSYGLSLPFAKAPKYYLVVVGSIFAGLIAILVHIHVFAFMFLAAVLNGFVSVPLLIVLLILANMRRCVGEHRNPWPINAVALVTIAVIGIASCCTLFGGTDQWKSLL